MTATAIFISSAATANVQDNHVELTLHSGACNEIGTELLLALEGFLETFDPREARALIIRSSRDSGFSAGADLRELHDGLTSRFGDNPTEEDFYAPGLLEELSAFLDRVHRVMDRIDTLPIPVIGVIHGVCFGGGFELALCCDVLIAESTARFAFPEMRLGIIPGFGGIPRLRREVGNAVVRDLLISGRSLGASRAHDLGFVSQVVKSGVGLRAARSLCGHISRTDRRAHEIAKQFSKPLPADELEREKALFLDLIRRPAAYRALAQFVSSSSKLPYLPAKPPEGKLAPNDNDPEQR